MRIDGRNGFHPTKERMEKEVAERIASSARRGARERKTCFTERLHVMQHRLSIEKGRCMQIQRKRVITIGVINPRGRIMVKRRESR